MYNFCQQTECLEVEPGVHVLAGVSSPITGIVYSLMTDAPPPAFFAADCPILPASVLAAPGSAIQKVTAALTAGAAAHSLRLALPQGESGTLVVYDVRGSHVRMLHSGVFGSGETQWVWDGRDDAGNSVPHGVYFVQVRTQVRRESERILLLP